MSSYTMPILTTGTASNQSVYKVLTTARHMPGTRGRLDDGREFEYCRSGHASIIPNGSLASYVPVTAAIDKIAVQAAAPIGVTSISVTVTLTLIKDELFGGWLSIDKNAGQGEMYRIVGHPAHTSGTLTLIIERPVATALTTSSVATIIVGASAVKVSKAVVALANPVEVSAGVPLMNVVAGDTTPQYFWAQKTGFATVLFGTAVGAVGQSVYQGEDTGRFQVATSEIDTNTDVAVKVSLGTIVALLPIDAEFHVVNLSIA